jgi:hypothetical protein
MRLKLTVSAAATAALVLAAGLGAASAAPGDPSVKVYGNSFSSENAMKQLVRVRRTGNTCSRAFTSASGGRMKITIGPNETKECAYDPLVIGGPDVSGASTEMDNLEVTADNTRISASSPAERLPRAFASVSIRDGDDGDLGWYLAVFPGATTPRWEVWKKPSTATQCTIVDTGTTGNVQGTSADNDLTLRVFEGDLSAKVNGVEVWSSTLNPGFSVDPDRTALSLGAASSTPRDAGDPGCPNTGAGGANGVNGSFDKMTVDVPDPKPDLTNSLPTVEVKEKGLPNGSSTPPASCPSSPCEAIGHLTGYQTQIQASPTPKTNPFGMTQATGKLVAWRLYLGNPNATQTNFFENFFGAGPKAAVGVLEKVPSYSNRFTLSRRFPGVDLEQNNFFGHRITVAPGQPLRINQDDKASMIVGTWAPAFATGISSTNTWRATREAGFPDPDVPIPTASPACSPGADGINFKNGEAHATEDTTARYKCNYNTARLMYTALIAVP